MGSGECSRVVNQSRVCPANLNDSPVDAYVQIVVNFHFSTRAQPGNRAILTTCGNLTRQLAVVVYEYRRTVCCFPVPTETLDTLIIWNDQGR